MISRPMVAAAVACLALAFAGREAAAKSMTGFVVTGGELGPYAAEVQIPIPADAYLPIGIPMSQLRAVGPPDPLPQLAYDLYGSPYRVAEGPTHVYYPEPRLIYDRSYDRWWELLPEAAAFMEGTVRDLLARKDAGRLERGVAAAWFRARNMPEGGYWLRLYVKDDGSPYDPYKAGIGCGDCAYISDPERFVMRHLVDTVSQPSLGSDDAPPAFAIEYFVPYGSGGYGGLLGFYTPLVEGGQGRFWTMAYYHDANTPFFKTTPGFDAAIADALSRQAERPPATEAVRLPDAPGSRSFPLRTLLGAGAAVWLACAIASVSALTSRRHTA